ncbi:M50 family metallopeptidase [Nocardia sp. NRRL S-836]|uniref:M50 family metallopeptidase n=1 Tax=Nocardia sp. NRRL S-836 TaxID=1519492 RepID=UPI0006AF1829|nr:M50 family metallopeptidase [Nocardia sp. NRRL S-836]KOV81578.1 membrane protein [Nocardia sp. NRRL S-836]
MLPDELLSHEVLITWGTALAAFLAVALSAVWRLTRNVITIAHEGGHALLAVLTGRRLSGIKLHSDTSGLTVSRGKPRGPGMVFTALAGYIAPSLLGFGAALLITTDQIRLMLWITIGFLAAMLIMIRNVFGVLSIIVTGAAFFFISFYAAPEVRDAAAYVFAWFLLLGGVRPVWELQVKRWRRQAPQSDADQLARLTGFPAFGWVTLFGLVSVAALVGGGALLLGRW